MAEHQLSVDEMLELYPFLNPDTIRLMVDRGLTFNFANAQKIKEMSGSDDSGGFFNPTNNTLNLPFGADGGTASHELVHAGQALTPELFTDVPDNYGINQAFNNRNEIGNIDSLASGINALPAIFGSTIDEITGGGSTLGVGGSAEAAAFQVAGNPEFPIPQEDRNKQFGNLFATGEVPNFDAGEYGRADYGTGQTSVPFNNPITPPPPSTTPSPISGSRGKGQSERRLAQLRRTDRRPAPRLPAPSQQRRPRII